MFSSVFAQNNVTKASSEEIDAIIYNMSLEQKITQMIIPGLRTGSSNPPVTSLNEDLRDVFTKYSFGDVALFAENIDNAEQAFRLIHDIQKTSLNGGAPAKLFIATDQEGGYVTRIQTGTQMPGNMALAASGNLEYAEIAAEVMGKELSLLGINTNLGPILDVNSNPANPIIGVRSFSDDPETVKSFGKAYIQGLHNAGVISVVKHFPGHGDTYIDSHVGLPYINKTLDELKSTDLLPFVSLLPYTDMVMTAHIQFPEIETEKYYSAIKNEEIYLPTTFSKKIITSIMREEFGFDGLITTDALQMGAIKTYFTSLEAARLAINAGVDILMVPIDFSNTERIAAMDDYIAGIITMVENGKISEIASMNQCTEFYV